MKILLRLLVIATAAALVPSCRKNSSNDVAAPLLSLLARGGRGTVGGGGNGNAIIITGRSGSDIRLLTSGSTNAVAAINAVSPALGATPLIIAADTTLTPPLVGSGLHVMPGVTLTLLPDTDSDLAPGNDRVTLALGSGVFIEGTVKIGPKNGGTTDASDVVITCTSFVCTGRIDLSGLDDAAAAGGLGGALTVTTTGSIITRGTIDATGGDGTTGGNGGVIAFNANFSIFNGGSIASSGGVGSTGIGGNAGAIAFQSSLGLTSAVGGSFNNGTLTARGGSSASGAGGSGASVLLNVNHTGAAWSGGSIDTGGGASAAGNGGSGSSIMIVAINGDCRAAGSLSSRGGMGTGGSGGNGGFVTIRNSFNPLFLGGSQAFVGGIQVSANIDSSGGDGDFGGSANIVNIDADEVSNVNPGVDTVLLLGYGLISTSGGAGATIGGGNALSITVRTLLARDSADTDGDGLPGPGNPWVGGIYNEVPIIATGGDGGSGTAGFGAIVAITTDNTLPSLPTTRAAINVAALDLRNGTGAPGGTLGGTFTLYDHYRVENHGIIQAPAGPITLSSEGVVINTASLLADSPAILAGTGLTGGLISITGGTVFTTGTLTCRGGATASGTGGTGGSIVVTSTQAGSVISGVLSVKPGTGTAAGANGAIFIDGVQLAAPEVSF